MRKHEKTRVLVVEDEPITRKRLVKTLEYYGYYVHAAATASSALAEMTHFQPHVVLLDILLPDSSDFSLAKRIAYETNCGVIITSIIDRRENRLAGLRVADDYLAKPYDMDELLLKVERLAYRIQGKDPSTGPREQFEFGGCTFDPARSVIIHCDGRALHLTSKERLLLTMFLKQPGRLFSRSQIIDLLQPNNRDISHRAIDSSISRLRHKIKPTPTSPEFIKSIYGEGYLLDSSVQRIPINE